MENKEMEQYEENQMILYVAFEQAQARNEREKKELIESNKKEKILIVKCWCISMIFTVLIFVGGFMYFMNTFEVTSDVTTTQEVEGDNANIVNDGQYNDNAVRNGD